MKLGSFKMTGSEMLNAELLSLCLHKKVSANA